MEIKEIKKKILETGDVTSCAVMIIEKKGDIIEYAITDPTKMIITLTDLTEISGIIALRYGIVGYDKTSGGLQMTMDIFRNHIISYTATGENILVTIVPNSVDVNLFKFLQELKNILTVELGKN